MARMAITRASLATLLAALALARRRRRPPARGRSRATASATGSASPSTAPTGSPSTAAITGRSSPLLHRHRDLDRDGGRVRVLLGSGEGAVGFTGASRACGKGVRPGRDYSFGVDGGAVVLRSGGGERLARCGDEGKASSGVAIEGFGRYRGSLVARATGGNMLVSTRWASRPTSRAWSRTRSRPRGRRTRYAPRRSSPAPTGSPPTATAPSTTTPTRAARSTAAGSPRPRRTNRAVADTAKRGRHLPRRPRDHLLLLDLRRTDRELGVRLRRRQADPVSEVGRRSVRRRLAGPQLDRALLRLEDGVGARRALRRPAEGDRGPPARPLAADRPRPGRRQLGLDHGHRRHPASPARAAVDLGQVRPLTGPQPVACPANGGPTNDDQPRGQGRGRGRARAPAHRAARGDRRLDPGRARVRGPVRERRVPRRARGPGPQRGADPGARASPGARRRSATPAAEARSRSARRSAIATRRARSRR